EGLLLAHVGHRRQLGDGLDLGQLLHLASVLEVVLELEGGVEVVLDRALVSAGHEDDLFEPGGHGLLDHVLDRGLVHQGQHLLRLGLGGRKESCAKSGSGEYGFLDGRRAHGRVPSSGVLTWILSFLTRYQRLRSEMPSSFAARAWTPLTFWSASRIRRRSPSASTSSSDAPGGMASGLALVEVIGPPRWIAGDRCSGAMTPSDSTMAASRTCCSSRIFPGHGYVQRHLSASGETVDGPGQSLWDARSIRCEIKSGRSSRRSRSGGRRSLTPCSR